MPYAENRGTKIYWEEQGVGEPLVLVMGLASTLEMWHRTAPVLAQHFRTIVFDNRGVGRSDVPAPGYPLRDMADDLKAVMDAAGVSTAHLFGISMGGMIAQEFTLAYPDRVRSLILGCTNFGGREVEPAAPHVLAILKARGEMSPLEAARAMVPHIYSKNTDREIVEEDIYIRIKWFPSPQGYYGQLGAILAWESRTRLPQVSVPTLVLHGDTDELVPPANGRMIAGLIPNSELHILPQASHIFMTDQPDLTHRLILEFLEKLEDHSRGRDGDSTRPGTH